MIERIFIYVYCIFTIVSKQEGKMISWLEKHNKLSCIITIVIAIIIFYISSLTAEEAPGRGLGINAAFYHITIFFLLAFFLLISVIQGKNKKLILPAIFLVIIYAILDEFHQYFVPGRFSAFSDVILDSIGIAFASILYFISLEYRK